MPDWEEYNYDPVWQTERLFKEASKMKGDLFKIFEKEWIQIRKLQKYADMDGVPHIMCHNDINIDNVLLSEDGTLDIIDYEFAGYNDPGYDFGRVIAGLEYDTDEPKIMDILEAYFGCPATELEHLHWMATRLFTTGTTWAGHFTRSPSTRAAETGCCSSTSKPRGLSLGACRATRRCTGSSQIRSSSAIRGVGL